MLPKDEHDESDGSGGDCPGRSI